MAFLNPIAREMRLGSGVMDWRWLLNQLNRRQRRSVHSLEQGAPVLRKIVLHPRHRLSTLI